MSNIIKDSEGYFKSTIQVKKDGEFNSSSVNIEAPTVIVDDANKSKIKFFPSGISANSTETNMVASHPYSNTIRDMDNTALGFSSNLYDVIYIKSDEKNRLNEDGGFVLSIKHALEGRWIGFAYFEFEKSDGTSEFKICPIADIPGREDGKPESGGIIQYTFDFSDYIGAEGFYILLFRIGQQKLLTHAAEQEGQSGLLEANYQALKNSNDIKLLAADTPLSSTDNESNYYRLPFTGKAIEDCLRKAGCLEIDGNQVTINSIKGLTTRLTTVDSNVTAANNNASNALIQAIAAAKSSNEAKTSASNSQTTAQEAAKTATEAKNELISSKPKIGDNGHWFIGDNDTDVEAQGPAGENSYVHIKYSKVAHPTSKDEIKDTPDTYVGILTDNTPTASDDPNQYTWSRFQGEGGQPGEPGKTPYIHFAYANDDQGTGFSTTDSTNKLYLGQYADYEKEDSKDYKVYTWTRIKGETGKPGDTGRGISYTKSQYAISATTTTPNDDNFADVQPTLTQEKPYLWQKTITYYTDNTHEETSKPHIIGVLGKDGKNGSDALVDFANVCAALGISGSTDKGLYATKDEKGNDVIAINADTIFADEAFANHLKAVNVEADNLKVNAANIKDLTADKIVLGKNEDGTTNNIELTSDGRIRAKNIEADQLEVKAANITGQLTASQIDASDLKVDSANITGKLTANQIDATNLSVDAGNIKNLTADKIIINSNTGAKITLNDGKISADSIDVGSIKVGGTQIEDGAITTDKIAAGSIDASKIKANSITADQIDADALVAKKVEATVGKIAGFTISDNSLSTEGITSISDDTHDSGVYIGTDGIRLGKTFTVSKEGTVTASGFKISLTDEQKKELAGTGIATSVARNAFSENEWNTYGEVGHHEPWGDTAAIRRGCRIGDLFTVVGTATDTRSAHVLTYKSTTDSGNLEGDCISHQITERGLKGDKGDTGPQGEQGQQGIQGPAGPDGVSSYFHIKYSAVENPTDKDLTESPSKYIGTYTDNEKQDSSSASKYEWHQLEGDQGIPGTNGKDGASSYVHIAYADDVNGKNFTASNANVENKPFIGQYVDNNKEDSTDPSKYKWTKIKGEQGDKGIPGEKGDRGDKGDSVPYLTITATEFDQSGALGTFSFNGEQFATTQGRGHTIVTFNPKTHTHTDPVCYDTYGGAIDDFKAALKGISNDVILLLSSCDATKLDEESREILQTFGAIRTDTWNSTRYSHAFIGMKNHGTAFEAIGSGSDGLVTITANINDEGPITTKSVVEIVEWYAISATTSTPTDADFSPVPKTPDTGHPYVWKVTKTTYTDGTTTTSTPQIIGYKGKDGSDAEVKFSNVCNALGITTDGSDGAYWSKETADGKDKLVIKSSAFFADKAFTDELTANRIILDGASGKKIELQDGKISANSINVDAIAANQAIINKIQATEIDAGKITTGTINAARIDVDAIATNQAIITQIQSTNISADNITTGTLSADRIQANSITASKIDCKSLATATAFIDNLKVGAANIDSLTVDKLKFSTDRVRPFFISDSKFFSISNIINVSDTYGGTVNYKIKMFAQSPIFALTGGGNSQDYAETTYSASNIAYTKKTARKTANTNWTLTNNNTYTLTFPEKTGTIAITNDIPSVINNLTNSSTTNALSANMGKSLNSSISSLNNEIDSLSDTASSLSSSVNSLSSSVSSLKNKLYNIKYGTTTVAEDKENSIYCGSTVYCAVATWYNSGSLSGHTDANERVCVRWSGNYAYIRNDGSSATFAYIIIYNLN